MPYQNPSRSAQRWLRRKMEKSDVARTHLAFAGCAAFCWCIAGCAVDDRMLLRGNSTGGSFGDGATSETGGQATASGGAATGGRSGSGGKGTGGATSGGTVGTGGGAEEDAGCTEGCPNNLLLNPDFDADVSNWMAEDQVTIAWDPTNASLRTSSGSISIRNERVADVDNMTAAGAMQCVPVEGQKTYDIEAFVMPRVIDGTASGHINVQFYAADDCSGPPLPGGRTTASANRVGDWENDRGEPVASPDAHSMAFRLTAHKPLRDDPVEVVFDRVIVRAR
jgi:hypothetical protein